MNLLNVLAVCHTVVVDHDLETGEILYQASSPDELALVRRVKDAGFELAYRDTTKISVLDKKT